MDVIFQELAASSRHGLGSPR